MIRTINVAVAVALAGVVTFALFFLMQFLIATGQEQPERGERRVIADISIPEVEIQVQKQEPKPKEVEEPEEAPELPEPEFDNVSLDSEGISITKVEMNLEAVNSGVGISANDAEYLPIVTVPAQYPQRALQRGIEGWCQVMFTVNENGGVEDAVVVDAEPQGIFDRASLRAVARFRFNPRTVDGKPVKVPGVQYVFTYVLEEDE